MRSSNDGSVPNLGSRDKISMPITNVTKIMRQALPSHAKISDSAKEMTQQCVTEYISFVTKKAKERCQSEYRKIMNAEDLLWALENLGFDESVGPLTIYLQRYRHSISDSLCTHLAEPIPVTVRQSVDSSGPSNGPLPALEPTSEMLQPPLPSSHDYFGPDFSMDPNSNMEMFAPNDMNEFYMDEFGVGSLDNPSTNFDPSAAFKHD
ncbi:hypothetical protein VNO77_43161 [Canavalia gladiata]|uniref:Transcription factor CBF/NF-Y/archaeal histone domain-containing protein n=1 Tax=Canavalia gladiata TaxID=3824 RepID=A0AAN9JX83_CANGL